MESSEIFIRTISVEKTENANTMYRGSNKRGVDDTMFLPIDLTSIHKIDLNENLSEKPKINKLDKLLSDTNQFIKTVSDGLSGSFENSKSLSEMEIEFSLGFTENLKILMFEVGSNQAITVKIKLQKTL